MRMLFQGPLEGMLVVIHAERLHPAGVEELVRFVAAPVY
jgi:hypothetical protein